MSSSDSYRLLQCIGNGASGSVYRAESGATQVAVRQFQSIFPPGSADWQADRQHFIESGRRALRLKHNRIVPVLDVIDESGEAFIVMEYQTGETLQAALAARRFDPGEADVLLRQAAIALDFANESGVFHGDVKPSNIFLHPQLGARVADFGISPRARRDRRAMPANLIHGYLSPEHLRNPVSLGAQSDQYSLAVIGYEMYTGQSPYGAAASSPGAAIAGAPIAPASKVNRQLPSTVDAPLTRALDRDPARRFASSMEFIATLDAGLIRAPESNRRSSKLLYAAIASLVLALASLYFLLPGKKPPKDTAAPQVAAQAPPASEETKKGVKAKKGKSAEADTGKAPGAPVKQAAAAPKGADPKPIEGVKKGSPFGSLPQAALQTVQKSEPVRNLMNAVGAAGTQTQAASGAAQPAGGDSPRQTRPQGISSAIENRGFSLTVFSRKHTLAPNTTFALGDQQLGELGAGDIKALVQHDGGQPPKGRLSLDWVVDGVVMDAKFVTLGQTVEYRNEPTAGTYQVTLRLDTRPVQSFTFRITP